MNDGTTYEGFFERNRFHRVMKKQSKDGTITYSEYKIGQFVKDSSEEEFMGQRK